MARFHVYRLKQSETLVVDLQADLFDMLKTRIVAPLIPAHDIAHVMASLNPRATINGNAYVVAIHLLAAISLNELGELIGDLSNHRDKIVAATDFAFQGF
ncbi:CcdB family protein [Sinorhizobium americanum]|uniref:Toxin CcdB n=1 Tax=Sinorhizobium americanum TaxID=194963 RepID=A0A4R2CB82_9HYPH|nr:CcdB family protein [Sinorhizobium americanum]APG83041.1 plasmid maintenance protein, CcdB [Sinorhizobium americanum CCGM7]TCN36054.1 toxin CcdB [Sinorhizobium americanum]